MTPQLHYYTATISHCLDLTDPDAVSIPVAVVLVGETGEYQTAAMVCLTPKLLELKGISSEVLRDLPQLIRRHIDRVMTTLDDGADLKVIAHSLHDALRNSLHVSAVQEQPSVTLPASQEEQIPVVVKVALKALRDELRNTKNLLAGAKQTKRPRPPEVPADAPTHLFQTTSWPLELPLCQRS